MKLFKKLLSTIISVGLIFSVASLSAFAEGSGKTQAVSISEIPATLEECCLKLDELLREKEELKERIKSSSDWEIGRFHLGLGLWIRNNWIYPCPYGRISKLFYDNGGGGPDDISHMILENYRNYLLTGESTKSVEDFVVDYEFKMLKRFGSNVTHEQMKEKIRKLIENRASHKNKNSWLCTIL